VIASITIGSDHDYYHDHSDHRPKHTWRDQREYSDRHRDDDDFKKGKYKDADLSAKADSLLKGDHGGGRVRFKNDDKRWQEIVQKNERDQKLKRQHEDALKKYGKTKTLDERFKKDSDNSRSKITTVGPLNIRTKEASKERPSSGDRSSGNRIVVTPGKGVNPTTKDDRSTSGRFEPGNRNTPISGRGTPTSDTLKKLREQNEKMQRENTDRARKEAEQRNNFSQKDNERRMDILKKQADEARRRQSQPSGNQGKPAIKLPTQRSPEPKREIKLPPQKSKQPEQRQPEQRQRQPEQSSKRPEQSFKKPEQSSSSSSKSKSSDSSKGKAPSRRPSNSSKKKKD